MLVIQLYNFFCSNNDFHELTFVYSMLTEDFLVDQVLLMTLQNAPPGLDYDRDKRFSKVVLILLVNSWVVNALQL